MVILVIFLTGSLCIPIGVVTRGLSKMSFRPLILLAGSCVFALAFAGFALASGAGLLTAFFIYSFGGSAALVIFSMISFLKEDAQTVGFEAAEHRTSLGQLQGV